MKTNYTTPSVKSSALILFWPLLVITALAMTLRPTITATGPLLDDIMLATGISLQAASLLVVLPMLCMGIYPLLLPWVEQWLSENVWIVGGLFAIALSGLWRLMIGSGSALIASAFIGGSGIAIVQTLAPGIVKRWYPRRVPLAMGIYSAALMIGGGGAAILSPLVAQRYDSWQAGLGVWLLVPVIALVLWLFRPKEAKEPKDDSSSINFFGNRRAWLLATYFGLANAGYACMIAWLPSYARSLGFSAQGSGELIGFMTIFQVIGALGVPLLSANRLDRRPWLWFAIGIQVIGFVGLIIMPTSLLMLWVALIGCGLGACFSLTLTVALDHIATPKLAGALAAFVQGIGFIITAIAPYIAGILRAGTGSFQSVWLMLTLTLIAMLVVTIKFDPADYTKAINITKPH